MIFGGLYDMNTGNLISSRDAKDKNGNPVLPTIYELERHICLFGETLPESVVVTHGSKAVKLMDQDGNQVSSTIETILLNGKEYQRGTCERAVNYE